MTRNTQPEVTATPAAQAYKKWYASNKEEFNRKRAEKYANSEALREAARRKQKLYRDTKPREVPTGQTFKTIKGKQVEVFRIGKVGEMIGRDEQTIRSWERKGYIPKPIVKSTHRFYTMNQVALLREFGDRSASIRWDRTVRSVDIPAKIADIKARWAGV